MCVGRRFLAVEPNFGAVTECGCGTVHLTIGTVSIALHAQSLRKLHGLITAALKEKLPSTEEEVDPESSQIRRVLPVQ